ncbi:MAG: hypothetical protein CSA76_00690 [Spirochaetales bacterium]|nr:MAG: hypothetical protein CSA76_00690 [Spirochaetales bacterium]
MLIGLLQVIVGIVSLSLVVIIHEGGHFLAARLAGVEVETFSVGFGKRIAGYRKNGTDFRLSLIPLGGYCRFKGEGAFHEALENHSSEIAAAPGEFYASSPWKRIFIAAAGPLANLVFAVIVFTGIAWIGYQEHYTEPRIVLVSDFSDDETRLWPADKAGLQTGDLIVSVNSVPLESFQALREHLIFKPGETIELTVERNGQLLRLSAVPELDKENGSAMIGVYNWIEPLAEDVLPGTAAEKAGLRPGDRIISMDGEIINNTISFFNLLQTRTEGAGTAHVLEVERRGKTLELMFNPEPAAPSGIIFPSLTRRSPRLNVFQAAGKGIEDTMDILVSTVKGLRLLFMGVSVQNTVYGPIRLITDTGAFVVKGFQAGAGPGFLWTFQLMSIISISLAFLNLLPIPVLDGGQILLFLLEGIRKSLKRGTLHPRSIYRYQFIGTIIVAIIAAVALTGDILSFNGR